MSSDPRVPPPFIVTLTAAEYANTLRSVRGRYGGQTRPHWTDRFLSLRRFKDAQSSPETLQLLQPRTLSPGEIIYLPSPPARHQSSVPISSEAARARAAQTANPGVVRMGETPIATYANRAHPVMVQPAMVGGRTPPVTTNVPKIKEEDVVITGETRPTCRFRAAIPVGAGAATAPKPVADAVPAPPSIQKRPAERVIDAGRMKQIKAESYKPAGTVSSTIEIIEVDDGEDVSDAVRKHSLKRQRNISILGATGNISKAVLRVPQEPRPRVLEGELIIVNMQGVFVYPVPGGKEDNRAGGMSLSVGSSTGVFGGGVAGSVIASGKVKVSVVSFTASDEQRKAGNY